jgi:hypothetical protein
MSIAPFALDYAKLLNDFADAKCPATVRTFFFDLDQCTLYGEDFNDIVTLFQQTGKSYEHIRSLVKNLVNPSMVRAAQTLLAKYPSARIVLYTKKSGFITRKAVPLSMLKAGEAYIPSHTSMDDILNAPDVTVPDNMITSYQRLFLAREIVQETLCLSTPPEIIITSVRKNVRRACITLLNPPTDPNHAFLWDDNEEIACDPHVIPVPKYNAVPPSVAELINRDLDSLFQNRGLDIFDDASTINFLKTARPGHCCYNSFTNRVHVYTAKTNDLVDWVLPDMIDESVFAMYVVLVMCRFAQE